MNVSDYLPCYTVLLCTDVTVPEDPEGHGRGRHHRVHQAGPRHLGQVRVASPHTLKPTEFMSFCL